MDGASIREVANRLTRLRFDIERLDGATGADQLLKVVDDIGADVHATRVRDFAAVWQLRRGELLRRMERPAEAEAAADSALAALGAAREDDLQVAAWLLKARCRNAVADWEGLDRTAEAGIGIVERHRYSLSAPYLRASYMRDRIGLYALGVRAAHELGDVDGLVRRMELSKCRTNFGPLRAAGCEESVALRKELEKLSDQVDRAERISSAAAEPIRIRRRALWDRYAMLNARAKPKLATSLRRVQHQLNPDEAVLYFYWIDDTKLLRLVFDRTDHWIGLEPVSQEDKRKLESTIGSVAHQTHIHRELTEISAILWPPDARAQRILGRATRLLLSPHRELHSIPFGALRLDGSPLISRKTIRYAPNLSCMLIPPASRTGNDVVIAGVRDYSAWRDAGQRWNDLHEVERECQAIQLIHEAWGASVRKLLNEAVTENALRPSKPAELRILHLACHGEDVRGDTPLESLLGLHNSGLDGLDISMLELGAEMVVLSACHAGKRVIGGRHMDQFPGDDLLGLQAAFFAAGAQYILGTHREVDSGAASEICPAFHERFAGGCPPDIALAEAVRRSMYRPGNSSPKPDDLWSPFFLTAIGPNPPSKE